MVHKYTATRRRAVKDPAFQRCIQRWL